MVIFWKILYVNYFLEYQYAMQYSFPNQFYNMHISKTYIYVVFERMIQYFKNKYKELSTFIAPITNTHFNLII